MKAFTALVHREFIEHRGAFFIAPLVLVGVLFALTLLAFGVGRVGTRFSGALVSIVPSQVFEIGYAGFASAWGLYLGFVLFFYCADGFAADKRNNAMLFWKSMPVSDFRILLSKLTAALTILPGAIYAVALISILLLFGVAYATALLTGLAPPDLLGSIILIYGQMSLSFLVVLLLGLIWYLPYMALVGAMATAVGRWAIPLAFLLPSILSALEWVVLGGRHPFATATWAYLEYRSSFPLSSGYLERLWEGESEERFRVVPFLTDLLVRFDWMQAGLGAVFALAVIYLASEYRRRSAAN